LRGAVQRGRPGRRLDLGIPEGEHLKEIRGHADRVLAGVTLVRRDLNADGSAALRTISR
jgi:hypothetical protein